MEQNGQPAMPLPGGTSSSPGSPAEAFEQFVELIRRSRIPSDTPPEDILCLLRPFIVNPRRNGPAVEELVKAYAFAAESALLRPVLHLAPMMSIVVPSLRKLRGTIEERSPQFVERLRSLEAMLKTDLRPGSIFLNLRPIRYLDTPPGYGPARLHRYHLGMQTLVDPTPDDTLEEVQVRLAVTAEQCEPVIDAIAPGPGFLAVEIRNTAGTQVGANDTLSEGRTISVGGGPAAIAGGLKSGHALERSATLSLGTERSHARNEQYLVARRAGNRAFWNVLAGVGAVDAGGTEYEADVLIPDGVRKISVSVEARVDWTHGGTVPMALEKAVTLPEPTPAPTA